MARPREFDEDEVLDKALMTFWSNGYDGTSMEDLVRATGLARASLYGAFGDKENLFARVLRHYLSKSAIAVDERTAGTVREALRAIVSSWVAGCCAKDRPQGCFLSLAGTSGTSAASVRTTLADFIAGLESALTDLIERGQRNGELSRRAKPDVLARLLVVVQQGIATSARAGVPETTLREAVEEALRHVTD